MTCATYCATLAFLIRLTYYFIILYGQVAPKALPHCEHSSCGLWHCSALWHKYNPREYEEFGENANFEPFITKDMIALDACTYHTRKVNVVILED